jgi:hypothetical protein
LPQFGTWGSGRALLPTSQASQVPLNNRNVNLGSLPSPSRWLHHTCTRTFTSGLACAERTWRSMMLGDATPWLPLVIAACHAAVLPGNPPSTGNSARWPKAGGGDGVGPLRKPGYVRMPVSRHHFNGTKRSTGGGRHSSPRLHGSGASSEPTTAQSLAQRQYQNGRRWGWSALEELGGIAYIMQCVPHCPLAPVMNLGLC